MRPFPVWVRHYNWYFAILKYELHTYVLFRLEFLESEFRRRVFGKCVIDAKCKTNKLNIAQKTVYGFINKTKKSPT